jgi:hypothetical protein
MKKMKVDKFLLFSLAYKSDLYITVTTILRCALIEKLLKTSQLNKKY